MRKARFSEEQMVAIIREADREPVAAVAKRHGVSEQAIAVCKQLIHILGTGRAGQPLGHFFGCRNSVRHRPAMTSISMSSASCAA